MATTARTVEHQLDPGLPEARYFNRELSALDFNERVLTLAEESDAPLLERVKYAAIFASNLDEFYQVRVATLRRQQLASTGCSRSTAWIRRRSSTWSPGAMRSSRRATRNCLRATSSHAWPGQGSGSSAGGRSRRPHRRRSPRISSSGSSRF